MILEGERMFAAPRETVWHVLNDPASMAKTMPGVQSFDVQDERRWSAAGEMGTHSRDTRGRIEGARNAAAGCEDRLIAAGGSDHRRA